MHYILIFLNVCAALNWLRMYSSDWIWNYYMRQDFIRVGKFFNYVNNYQVFM